MIFVYYSYDFIFLMDAELSVYMYMHVQSYEVIFSEYVFHTKGGDSYQKVGGSQ